MPTRIVVNDEGVPTGTFEILDKHDKVLFICGVRDQDDYNNLVRNFVKKGGRTRRWTEQEKAKWTT